MELQPLLKIIRIVMVEPVHCCTVGSSKLGCLLDRIVGRSIQEDHAVTARKDAQDAAVKQGDGREHQDVRCPDKSGDLPFQVLVELRGGHGPSPARVHAPTFYRIGDRSVNRGVKIQA
jgi:hypothetical protein